MLFKDEEVLAKQSDKLIIQLAMRIHILSIHENFKNILSLKRSYLTVLFALDSIYTTFK